MTDFDKDPRYIYSYEDWQTRVDESKSKESRVIRHYPDCVRGHPVLMAIHDRTWDEWTDIAEMIMEASE